MTALMPAGTTASRSSRHLLMMGYKKHLHQRRVPRLAERQQPPHLRVQPLVGEGVRRELIAQEASDDFLGEDDGVQGHGACTWLIGQSLCDGEIGFRCQKHRLTRPPGRTRGWRPLSCE